MGTSLKIALRNLMAVLLVAALQLPTAVKISHALYEHIEVECDDFTSVHIHEAEFDCDYQKFNLSPKCILSDFKTVDHADLVFQENDLSFYSFLNKYQKLHFTLRGPPSFS